MIDAGAIIRTDAAGLPAPIPIIAIPIPMFDILRVCGSPPAPILPIDGKAVKPIAGPPFTGPPIDPIVTIPGAIPPDPIENDAV